jgi:peptide/nickel transport system substrate-binding protein
LGALPTMQLLVQPGAIYMPKDGKDDPDMLAAWNDMNQLPTPAERQAAFARMQKITLDKVYAVPFGSFTKVQAVRSDVEGFVPFRIPRMSNVWLQK